MPALLREWQKRKLAEGTNSFEPLEISRNFKCPTNQQLNCFQNVSFCNCPGNWKIKYIKRSKTNKNVKSILVQCKFPLDGSLTFPSILDNKLNESFKPLNHQHNERNTKYMSFSYRANETQLFLSYLYSEKEKITVYSSRQHHLVQINKLV